MVATFRIDKAKGAADRPENTSNYVNVSKLAAVVEQKIKNSELADSSMRFFTLAVLFIVVVIYQRDSSSAEEATSALRHFISESEYRDPVTHEMMSLETLRTIDDFWNWHHMLILPLLWVQNEYDGGVVPRNRTGTVLLHNRLISGLRMAQRRAKNGTCAPVKHMANVSTDCYGRIYWEGYLGDLDTLSFAGAIGGGKYVYRYQTIGVGPLRDFGFFETFDFNYTRASKRMSLLREDQWINKGSQYVRTDLTTYNSNTGTFIAVQIKFW